MKQICKQTARVASLLCLLTACSNGDNYPQEYIGFEKTTLTHSFNSNKDTEELYVKIIAADKKAEESPNLRVKIFPKKIKQKAIFRIVCTPQEKKAKKTEITVYLVRK